MRPATYRLTDLLFKLHIVKWRVHRVPHNISMVRGNNINNIVKPHWILCKNIVGLHAEYIEWVGLHED
jgi:hypothetical protein